MFLSMVSSAMFLIEQYACKVSHKECCAPVAETLISPSQRSPNRLLRDAIGLRAVRSARVISPRLISRRRGILAMSIRVSPRHGSGAPCNVHQTRLDAVCTLSRGGVTPDPFRGIVRHDQSACPSFL